MQTPPLDPDVVDTAPCDSVLTVAMPILKVTGWCGT